MLAISINSFSQSQSQSQSPSREQLLKKSRTQLIGGLLFSAAGVGLFFGGVDIAVENASNEARGIVQGVIGGSQVEVPKKKGASALMIAGIVCSATSIPFYIASGKNKKAARKLPASAGVILEQYRQLTPSRGLQLQSYPAVQLRVTL